MNPLKDYLTDFSSTVTVIIWTQQHYVRYLCFWFKEWLANSPNTFGSSQWAANYKLAPNQTMGAG
jgi:hypothetical protein